MHIKTSLYAISYIHTFMYINSMWVILKINKVDYRAQTIRRAANSKENKYIYKCIYIYRAKAVSQHTQILSLFIYKNNVVYACKQLSLSIPRICIICLCPPPPPPRASQTGVTAQCVWIKIRRRSYPHIYSKSYALSESTQTKPS